MSEFCYDCIQKLDPEIPPARNGLRHNEHGQLVYDICEGCGPGWFDTDGRRQVESEGKSEDEGDITH